MAKGRAYFSEWRPSGWGDFGAAEDHQPTEHGRVYVSVVHHFVIIEESVFLVVQLV